MFRNLLLISVVLFVGASFAPAGLIDWFDRFDAVSEVGVSGLQSSYFLDTKAGVPVSGATTSNLLPTLGPGRVSYPYSIGQHPSPGGSVGKHFDQGILGVLVEGGELTVRLATGLDPEHGYYYSGWNAWYSQGDVFLDVEDSSGIHHFSLLNDWARTGSGSPISLNGGTFNAAQNFHTTGGPDGDGLAGHLVLLGVDSDVAIAGGTGSYTSSSAPTGLDLRVFAKGGTDLGYAGLTHNSVTDLGQTWYIQTWTLDLSDLSADGSFSLALHSAASCGNDQIGGHFAVPEPSAVLAMVVGAAGLVLGRSRV